MSEYYLKHREEIIEKSKKNYYKRKEREPEFWKKLKPLTDEDRKRDEEQMERIIRYVREQREEDEKRERREQLNKKTDFLNYMLY
jgi:hypothetical protein